MSFPIPAGLTAQHERLKSQISSNPARSGFITDKRERIPRIVFGSEWRIIDGEILHPAQTQISSTNVGMPIDSSSPRGFSYAVLLPPLPGGSVQPESESLNTCAESFRIPSRSVRETNASRSNPFHSMPPATPLSALF